MASIKRLPPYLILSFFCTLGYSQRANLVPDPSFEESKYCPTHFTTINNPIPLKFWFSPTAATPDLFSGCNIGEAGVPINWAGTSYSIHGSNYAGLYLGNGNNGSYREYLSTKLIKPLKQGEKYQIQFFLKPSIPNGVLVDSIQILFTADSIFVDNNNPIESESAISIPITRPQSDKGATWNIASIDYEANGREQFLTIGNFSKEMSSGIVRKDPGAKGRANFAFYYFDYVEVVPNEHEEEFSLNETFILTNLNFEFDKSNISARGKEEISRLSDFLRVNPTFELKIMGYADSTGTMTYNQKLSFKRANSVRHALTQSGIDKKRIKIFALGESQNTFHLDSLNRRVEFEIIARDVWGDRIKDE